MAASGTAMASDRGAALASGLAGSASPAALHAGAGMLARPGEAGVLLHRIQQSAPAPAAGVAPATGDAVVRRRSPRKFAPTERPTIGLEFREIPRGLATATRPLMPPVKSWLYQLSQIDPDQIKNCNVEVAVIDFSRDGTKAKIFSKEEVEHMRRKKDGNKTIMLSYMSIGEAESYRDIYWKSDWLSNSSRRPKWLGPANDEGWGNNYRVRYWDPDWQKVIFGTPEAYLDRIIDAGFDGVYLDIVDGFYFWQERGRSPDGPRKQAAEDMIEFVGRLARHAWTKNPNFFIVPQNADELLESDRHRAQISAIAVEDVYYQWVDHGQTSRGDDVVPQDASQTRDRLANLRLAMRDRIPVLSVEYLMDQPEDRRVIPDAEKRMREDGVVPHFALRQLEKLSCPAVIPARDTPATPPKQETTQPAPTPAPAPAKEEPKQQTTQPAPAPAPSPAPATEAPKQETTQPAPTPTPSPAPAATPPKQETTQPTPTPTPAPAATPPKQETTQPAPTPTPSPAPAATPPKQETTQPAPAPSPAPAAPPKQETAQPASPPAGMPQQSAPPASQKVPTTTSTGWWDWMQQTVSSWWSKK